jgi:hypothetical protein
MYYNIFRKENVFTCVMFGAIFIFVVIKTIFNSGDLWGIAYLLAFPILILSILKLIITALEDANDKETEWLFGWEDCNAQYDKFKIRGFKKKEFNDYISTICENDEKNKIIKYKICFELREKFRFIRRTLLFFYYSVFMIVFVLLLLHTELSVYLKSFSIDTNALTMWSFIIILVEIMMKNILENIVFWIINKKYNINLENYWN